MHWCSFGCHLWNILLKVFLWFLQITPAKYFNPWRILNFVMYEHISKISSHIEVTFWLDIHDGICVFNNKLYLLSRFYSSTCWYHWKLHQLSHRNFQIHFYSLRFVFPLNIYHCLICLIYSCHENDNKNVDKSLLLLLNSIFPATHGIRYIYNAYVCNIEMHIFLWPVMLFECFIINY